jgi:polyisoprenoid-binding protein YceI
MPDRAQPDGQVGSGQGNPPSQHPPIDESRWRIDPARSSVEFRVRNLYGLQTVKGRFERYRGTLDLSAQPSIELTIDAASLSTNNAKRDKHLRSADFFDVDNHPQVSFVSKRAMVEGDRLYVFGDLEAAGRSIRLELDGTIRPVGDELELDVTTFADHRELGMTWNRLGTMRTPSNLVVRARLVRDEP